MVMVVSHTVSDRSVARLSYLHQSFKLDVSHTVSDRSLARLSYLHQSFKLDGVAASDIVVTLDI